MGNPNLVSLDDVKAWIYKTPIGQGAGLNEALIGNLITRCSQLAVSYINRGPLYKRTVTEYRDGYGSQKLLLKEYPVLSVTSILIDGVAIAAAAMPSAEGYFLEPWDQVVPGDPQMVYYCGGCFPSGAMRTKVTYVTGYTVLDEAYTIASGGGEYSVTTQPTWTFDEGVNLAATGVALTKVSGAPTTGQYALGSQIGQYIFAAADAGKAVLISYDFTPVDLYQTIIEWIAERYAYMDRIGKQSQTIGNQMTTSFIVKDIPDYIKLALKQYTRVVPV